MQEEEKKTVDIDTSGPDVDIELPEEKTEEVAEQPKEDKTYENEREQSLKTVVAPVTHLRNLWSSLLVRKVINNKITVNKLKSILRALKSEQLN